VDLSTKGLLITDNERKSPVVLQGQLDDCPEIDNTIFILWHPPQIHKKAGDLFSLFNFRFYAFTGLQLGHKFQWSREMVVKHVTRGNKGCLSWIIIHQEQQASRTMHCQVGYGREWVTLFVCYSSLVLQPAEHRCSCLFVYVCISRF
jgi:hypothetical protein